MMKLDAQVTGNVGLYYVCYKLSMMGWNVMPTARNARGIDIVIYSRDAEKFLGIQVKALSKRDAVPIGSSVDKVMGDFWVIVNRVSTQPHAYVMSPEEVRSLCHRSGSDKPSYWLEAKDYAVETFEEKWERIGYGESPALIPGIAAAQSNH